MKQAKYLVVIGIILLLTIPATGRDVNKQAIYDKLYRASCILQTIDGAVGGTGFCIQKNPVLIVTSRHVYESAPRGSRWFITRPEWPYHVGVQWVVTAWSDVMFFWNRKQLPKECELTPLRSKGRLPRSGEPVYMMGNFFTSEDDKLLSGVYEREDAGEYYCRFPATTYGSSGSAVVNRSGALIGIHAGETDFHDSDERLERFVPVEELEVIIRAVNRKLRER